MHWGHSFPDIPDSPDFPDFPDFPDSPDFPDIPDSPDFPDFPDIPDLALPRLSEREGLAKYVLWHDLGRIGRAFLRKYGEGEITNFLPCVGRIDFKARKRLDVNGTDAGV